MIFFIDTKLISVQTFHDKITRFKFDYTNEKKLKHVLQEHIVRDILMNTDVENQLQQV